MVAVSRFFQLPWPLWEALDWLQTSGEVPVDIVASPLHERHWWFVQSPPVEARLMVPRARRPQTFGFVGDTVRANDTTVERTVGPIQERHRV